MSRKIKGYCSVFGGFLIHLTLGTFYTIGNMNTYITSYLRKNGETNLTYSSAIWINTAAIVGMGIIMFFAGILDRRVGTSITCAIGCAIFTASTALTYFSVQSSFLLVVITYGLMPAIGSGLAYASPLVNSMKVNESQSECDVLKTIKISSIKIITISIIYELANLNHYVATLMIMLMPNNFNGMWFPKNKGIVTGITVAGFGLGALIFDQVQTLYLNPNNYSPKDDESIYFLRNSILRKVPSVFVILSLIYGIIQLIGVAFVFDAGKHLSRYDSNDLMDNILEESHRYSDITPRNALKFSNFYVLWVMFALGNQTIQFINTLYKPFGIDLKYEDHYLALVGSLASIFNAIGRIFWGKLMDKYNFKNCVVTLFAMLSVFMFTLIMTSNLGKVFFSIWILMIFFSFSGIFTMFPAVVATTYGPTHANTIYGMLFTAPAVTGVLGAVILEITIDNLGWFYSFIIVGFMSVFAMVTAIIFYR